jgi:hypothetical protein
MEFKGEMVTGPMLHEKCKHFEDLLKVLDIEHLHGGGWLTPFCHAYKIKEYWRHGEAGSADPDAVEAQWKHVWELMKKFAPKDQWNFDETSLFLQSVPLFQVKWTWLTCYDTSQDPAWLRISDKEEQHKKGEIPTSPLDLLVMPMAAKNCPHYTLEGQRIPAALVGNLQSNKDSIIKTITRLGWQQCYLRSVSKLDVVCISQAKRSPQIHKEVWFENAVTEATHPAYHW